MMGHIWQWIALAGAGAVTISTIVVCVAYSRDMRRINDHVFAGSRVIQTRHGPIEFTTCGSGPAVLVVHGAGGGYDQGTLIARAFGGDGFRWIAPSRFGYLRTPMPADASTVAQADAFAALLDFVEVGRVAILAMSGGGPPSLQFAQRYPARTSALVLLSSAPYTLFAAAFAAAAKKLPVPIWMYQMLFSSDFPFWLLQKIAGRRLEAIFDIKPGLRAALTSEESAFVAATVDAFQPVTKRAVGLANEGAALDPHTRYMVEAITAPTLVIHSRDDGINQFAVGEFIAGRIPGAEFLPLATGGHLLLGHQAEVRARVNSFLRHHAVGTDQ